MGLLQQIICTGIFPGATSCKGHAYMNPPGPGKSKARILASGRTDRCASRSTPIVLCTMVFACWKPWPVLSSLRTGCPIIASSTHSIARSGNTFGRTMATTVCEKVPSAEGLRERSHLARERGSEGHSQLWRTWEVRDFGPGGVEEHVREWVRSVEGCHHSATSAHLQGSSDTNTLSSMSCCPSSSKGRSTSPISSVWHASRRQQLLASTSPLTTRGNAVLIASIRRHLTHPRRGTSRAGGMLSMLAMPELTCPRCRKIFPEGMLVCLACGLSLATMSDMHRACQVFRLEELAEKLGFELTGSSGWWRCSRHHTKCQADHICCAVLKNHARSYMKQARKAGTDFATASGNGRPLRL